MSRDWERCIGAESHTPADLWSERHHVFPKFLCDLAGIPRRPELAPLCGTCHANVHHGIEHLLENGTIGHTLPYGSRLLVYRWWAWWQEAIVVGGGAT